MIWISNMRYPILKYGRNIFFKEANAKSVVSSATKSHDDGIYSYSMYRVPMSKSLHVAPPYLCCWSHLISSHVNICVVTCMHGIAIVAHTRFILQSEASGHTWLRTRSRKRWDLSRYSFFPLSLLATMYIFSFDISCNQLRPLPSAFNSMFAS
jgi:uncharacterized membrane protein